MRFSLATAASAALALSSSVQATLYMTNPVATTTCAAGANCTIAWTDDGTAPTLAALGACEVGLYTGNQNTQFLLQEISTSIDVSNNSAISFVPLATDGPNGRFYFIRFTSSVAKSTANAAYPAQAFSSMFTLSGMSGTFNSTVEQVLSASVSPASTAASSPAMASSMVTTIAKATTAAPSGSTQHASTVTASTAHSSTTAKSSAYAPSAGVSMVGVSLVGALGMLFGLL